MNWKLGNSHTSPPIQFGALALFFWLITLDKEYHPFRILFFCERNWAILVESLSNELISWLMFNFESDFSYIASDTTMCLFVKNWLVLHLNFTSVFCFRSYLEPNSEGGGRVEIASECLTKGQGGGKNPLVGRWSWSPWAVRTKVGQIQCFWQV